MMPHAGFNIKLEVLTGSANIFTCLIIYNKSDQILAYPDNIRVIERISSIIIDKFLSKKPIKARIPTTYLVSADMWSIYIFTNVYKYLQIKANIKESVTYPQTSRHYQEDQNNTSRKF